MKVIAICNLPDDVKLDHAWFVAEDGLYAQKVAIRPLPKKFGKEVHTPNNRERENMLSYVAGYNKCIDEITGETE